MSSATRRIRYERATAILVALGLTPDSQSDSTDLQRIAEAETALSERIQRMIAQLCSVGITKAKIAREIDIDPAALCELADGGTSRLGLESIWDGYEALQLFRARAGETLLRNSGAPGPTHAELLGFSAHPDEAKVTGAEALNTMAYNVLTAVGEGGGALRPFGPHINGASAVYTRDGHWILTAVVCPGPPEEMARAARDEVWHIQQWLHRHDAASRKPRKLKSAF